MLVWAKEEFRNRTDQVMTAKCGEGDFILGIFFLCVVDAAPPPTSLCCHCSPWLRSSNPFAWPSSNWDYSHHACGSLQWFWIVPVNSKVTLTAKMELVMVVGPTGSRDLVLFLIGNFTEYPGWETMLESEIETWQGSRAGSAVKTPTWDPSPVASTHIRWL